MTKELSLHHITKAANSTKDKPAALFMFHGYGSDENDLFSFSAELPEELFIISVRAPQPMQPYGNAWYTIHWDGSNGKFNDTDEAIASRDKIAAFIKEAIEAYNLDAANITLLGFSQGCILSLATALSYPTLAKNVIGLSGYIDPDMLIAGYETADFSNLNIFISHGTVDQVIPIEWAQKTPEFLNKLGFNITLKEYPVGHGVAPQNFYDLKVWLQKHI
ncbi:alpha/beta hydrolase [Aquimarina agarivorans]|uniref:alpha/beta hydrolase n=1 Tax=Aquimarina agarivorans TaxID=980584 RepID=UPI000248FC83|nr:dienelactone hydrolase family protein [Aquimarina agarivorans]